MGNPFISSGYGRAPNVHQLEGGESVLGLWIDGEDEQKPVITNVFMKSQHAVDGETTDLKSNSTERQGLGGSTKDLNSPDLAGFNWAQPLGDGSGIKLFSEEAIINYDFTSVKPPEVSEYTRQGEERTRAQILAAQRIANKEMREFLYSEETLV